MIADDGTTTLRVRDIELCLWEHIYGAPPESDAHRIYVHKDRRFLAAMAAVLDRVAPRRMIEVGIFAGGSVIYWAERYTLDKLAAFDLRLDAPALSHYLDRHGLTDRVRTYFGVSQDDGAALRGAVAADFGNDLVDVVIDDASHEYAPTRATLEILLPFVRPGGAYVLEDWAWPPIRPLLSELPSLLWNPGDGVIDSIEIYKNFAVLWRGTTALPTDGTFKLPAP